MNWFEQWICTWNEWWGRRAIRRKLATCKHEKAVVYKWLDKDGTPMATTFCNECGWCDSGPVFADPETWLL